MSEDMEFDAYASKHYLCCFLQLHLTSIYQQEKAAWFTQNKKMFQNEDLNLSKLAVNFLNMHREREEGVYNQQFKTISMLGVHQRRDGSDANVVILSYVTSNILISILLHITFVRIIVMASSLEINSWGYARAATTSQLKVHAKISFNGAIGRVLIADLFCCLSTSIGHAIGIIRLLMKNHTIRRADIGKRVLEALLAASIDKDRNGFWTWVLDKLGFRRDVGMKPVEFDSESLLFPWHLLKFVDDELSIMNKRCLVVICMRKIKMNSISSS